MRSPIIAIILMVAITIVLAATIYVWVSGFHTGKSGENAAVAVKGETGKIVVTLVKAGDHYSDTNGYTAGNFSIYIDGNDVTPSGNWKVGQPFEITQINSNPISAGTHHVTVEIWDTTVYDGTVITY